MVLLLLLLSHISHVWFFATPWTAARQASCLLPSPGVSLTVRWQTISSSLTPFSSCPQSFPALGSFPMSRLFASGGQSVGASASASVLPMNIQGYIEGINQGCCVQLRGWCLDAGWISQRSAPVFHSHKSIIHSTSRGLQPSSLGLRVLFPGLISYPV